MQPRANHYDPKGNGSMLSLNDTLLIGAVMFPYVTNNGDIEWALGLANKSQTELDNLASQAAAAADKDAARRVLSNVKTLAFSTLCRKSVTIDKDGNAVDFEILGTASTAVRSILVDANTTEASFAQAWAVATAGRTGVKATKDMICTAASGRKYRRVTEIDLF